MRALFVAPSSFIWRSCFHALNFNTMTTPRRSSRISERAAMATQSADQTPLPKPQKRRRRATDSPDGETSKKAENSDFQENSLTLTSEATEVTLPSSTDDTATQEIGTRSQDTALPTPRKRKLKPPPPPIYPPDMARPYNAPRDTLRIVTWNIASFRSVARNGSFTDYLFRERPDMLCVQETKMTEEAMEDVEDFDGYSVHWNHSKKKGYSGVAIFVRKDLDRLGVSVTSVEHGCGNKIADNEGRVTTMFFSNSIALVNAYVPNSGSKLARLEYRTQQFEPAMRDYLNGLAEKWSVVYTGDLNVAHEVIDIHNSKGNQKSAGHTPEERAAFGEFLKSGDAWADSWRRLYPEYSGYTYYSRRFGDRLKRDGKGWRLDYFVINEKTFKKGAIKDIFVRPEVDGSDHYPLVVDYQVR